MRHVPTRMQTLCILFVCVVTLCLSLPTSYVVEGAGPAFDVNAEISGKKIVTISGEQTYPTQSQLFLTTVTAWGTADQGVSGFQALRALLDPHEQLYPVRALYPPSSTAEEIERKDTQAMESSQDSAAAVAMALAGLPVTEKLTVASVDTQFPASAHLREGDELQAIREHGADEYRDVKNFIDVSTFMTSIQPGNTIDLRVLRHGEIEEISFEAVTPEPDATGWVRPGAMIGVGLRVSDVELPASAEYAVDNIGGPSAGMMFTLGIYDALTEGSLAGQSVIGGTGTMSWNGDVGAIGGIAHKLLGAHKAGVTDFLAPAANCVETDGYIPEGMHVWAVRNISEAIAAAEAIGAGDTSELTACSAIS